MCPCPGPAWGHWQQSVYNIHKRQIARQLAEQGAGAANLSPLPQPPPNHPTHPHPWPPTRRLASERRKLAPLQSALWPLTASSMWLLDVKEGATRADPALLAEVVRLSWMSRPLS